MKLFFVGLFYTFIFSQNLERFEKNVTFLSSDHFQGRHFASQELKIAAKYVAEQFKEIGLIPFTKEFLQTGEMLDKPINNVVGIIPSKVTSTKSILFMAHLDGLGIGEPNNDNDSIYNGALDNTVGVAAIIEFAEHYKSNMLNDVNLIFVATSPEEGGAQGSEFFLSKYHLPKEDIVMVINCDGFNILGPTHDYSIFPKSGVSFHNTISNILKNHGYAVLVPNFTEYLNKSFDTKTFLSQGIPAVTIWNGNHLKGYTLKESIRLNVFGKRHHSADDEVTEEWNFEGVKQHFDVILKIVTYYSTNQKKEVVLDTSLFE